MMSVDLLSLPLSLSLSLSLSHSPPPLPPHTHTHIHTHLPTYSWRNIRLIWRQLWQRGQLSSLLKRLRLMNLFAVSSIIITTQLNSCYLDLQ